MRSPRLSLLRVLSVALVFGAVPTARSEVFVVRPRGGPSGSIAATLATKSVGEKFCQPFHCIVTTRSPAELGVLRALEASRAVEIEPVPDAHKVFFANAVFDGDAGAYSKDFPGKTELASGDPMSQFVVMFKSHPEADWLNEIAGMGGLPLNGMPSMSYLVYGPRGLPARIAGKNYVFRVEEIPAGIKRFGLDDPKADPNAVIPTYVSIANVSASTVKDRISKSHGGTPPSTVNGNVEMLEARMPYGEAVALSRLPEVVTIARSVETRPSDERSNRIIAGGLPGTGASSWPPSLDQNQTFWNQYLSNLASIPTFNLSNQVIGFLDTGIDAGMKGCGNRCPPYLRGTTGDVCRLVYTNDITTDFYDYPVLGGDPASNRRATDYYYHGTLTTSIAAGFVSDESPGRDSGGYAFTQGVAQGARVAMAKVYAIPFCDPNRTRTASNAEGGSFAASVSDSSLRYSVVALSGQSALPDGAPAGPGARLFNHSWNSTTEMGYDQLASTMDSASYNLGVSFTFDQGVVYAGSPYPDPTLHVVSAGNCFPNCNPAVDVVESPATAKNVIAVGATYSDNNQELNSQEVYAASCPSCNALGGGLDYRVVAPFSRSGAPGNRIKPDLVAPGVRSYGRRSSAPFFCGGDNCNSSIGTSYGNPPNAYKWSSGTSFAAPVVTGAAAVVSEWLYSLWRNGSINYWTPDFLGRTYPTPSLIKAVLIGGAKDLCPSDNCPLPGYPGRVMRSAPDHFQGWGGVSFERLFGPASNYYLMNRIQHRVFEPWNKTLQVVDGSRPITVTIVWADPASYPGTAVDRVLTADLDLQVSFTGRDGIARTYYGNLYGNPNGHGFSLPNPQTPTFDRANNVERVTIRTEEAPAAGSSMTVNVTALTYGPVTCQHYPLPEGCFQRVSQDFAVFVGNAHQN